MKDIKTQLERVVNSLHKRIEWQRNTLKPYGNRCVRKSEKQGTKSERRFFEYGCKIALRAKTRERVRVQCTKTK